jgi:hypothetical protein
MEQMSPATTLAKPLAIVAGLLGAVGCALILSSSGPAGTPGFMIGLSLFVPGLPIAIIAVIIGVLKRPRALLLPFVALAINLIPVVLFFFLASVLSGMSG